MSDPHTIRVEHGFGPPKDTTEQRLDAVLGELRAIRDLLTPKKHAAQENVINVEVREPDYKRFVKQLQKDFARQVLT